MRTLAACWRRPSLTALEVLWRWVYGVPALTVVGYETPVDIGALERMSLFDPMGAAATLAETGAVLLPAALRVAEWLGPMLLVAWVVVSAVNWKCCPWILPLACFLKKLVVCRSKFV